MLKYPEILILLFTSNSLIKEKFCQNAIFKIQKWLQELD